MASVIAYRNDEREPYAEVLLDSRERVLLRLDGGGAVIEQLPSHGRSHAILFEGSAALVSKICTGLLDRQAAERTTPLDTLLAAILLLRCAADVGDAFRDAAARLTAFGGPD